jgi:hypothetical protein
MGRVLLRNAVTTLGRRYVWSGGLPGRFFAIDRDGTMRIKVIQNGDGYQLQRLGDSGKILNVRPGTVEEYRLYQTAREQSQVAERAYGAQKAAEDRAKEAETELRWVRIRLAEAEALADRFSKTAEDAEAETNQQETRAEAAEAERDELRVRLAEFELEVSDPNGSKGAFAAFEAHNGR